MMVWCVSGLATSLVLLGGAVLLSRPAHAQVVWQRLGLVVGGCGVLMVFSMLLMVVLAVGLVLQAS